MWHNPDSSQCISVPGYNTLWASSYLLSVFFFFFHIFLIYLSPVHMGWGMVYFWKDTNTFTLSFCTVVIFCTLCRMPFMYLFAAKPILSLNKNKTIARNAFRLQPHRRGIMCCVSWDVCAAEVTMYNLCLLVKISRISRIVIVAHKSNTHFSFPFSTATAG